MENEYILIEYPDDINDDYININSIDNLNIDLKKTHDNNIIIEDYKKFFYDLEQHLNNKQILKQFDVDFKRCKVYYNDIISTNKQIFLTTIKQFHNIYYYKILLLCTQAVLSDITILLTNYFKKFNLIFAEHNKRKKRKLIIKVCGKSKVVNLIIIKYMRLFYLDKNSNDITTHTIKITQLIELDKNIIIKISLYKR